MPQVKLFGNLRDHAPSALQEITAPTVGDALSSLCAGNVPLYAALFEGEELRPHVRVMVNGRDIGLEQGLATRLSTTDQIAIFPPLAGG